MVEFDRDKVVDCMFDPVTSQILAELEGGEKECSELAAAASIPEQDVVQRLTYLVETGFISQRSDGRTTHFSANTERLTELVEDGQNFDSAIDGLEKMDSYLN